MDNQQSVVVHKIDNQKSPVARTQGKWETAAVADRIPGKQESAVAVADNDLHSRTKLGPVGVVAGPTLV